MKYLEQTNRLLNTLYSFTTTTTIIIFTHLLYTADRKEYVTDKLFLDA